MQWATFTLLLIISMCFEGFLRFLQFVRYNFDLSVKFDGFLHFHLQKIKINEKIKVLDQYIYSIKYSNFTTLRVFPQRRLFATLRSLLLPFNCLMSPCSFVCFMLKLTINSSICFWSDRNSVSGQIQRVTSASALLARHLSHSLPSSSSVTEAAAPITQP